MESARAQSKSIQSNLRSFLIQTLNKCVGNILTQGHRSLFERAHACADCRGQPTFDPYYYCNKMQQETGPLLQLRGKCYVWQLPENRKVIYEIRAFDPPWELTVPASTINRNGPRTCQSKTDARAKCAKCARKSWAGGRISPRLHGMDLHANLIPNLLNEVHCRTVSSCNSLRVPMLANESSAL